MKKVIIITASLWLFIQGFATAQESPPPNSTPIPTVTGTVTAFVGGQSISIDISPTDHRTFHVAKVLEVIAPGGDGVDPAAITAGSTVTLHFIQDYGDIIVDRIRLAQQ